MGVIIYYYLLNVIGSERLLRIFGHMNYKISAERNRYVKLFVKYCKLPGTLQVFRKYKGVFTLRDFRIFNKARKNVIFGVYKNCVAYNNLVKFLK